MRVDVLIFGGGGAGLWLLDELRRRGYVAALLEADALGAGQTGACQGIIHGGIKYTLSGLLNESARAIREMPAVWRACLTGAAAPDLRAAEVPAPHCHLWRTSSLKSKAGLVGARIGLRSGAEPVAAEDRPAVLAACPGDVFLVEEQVVDTITFVRALADRHADRILKIDGGTGAAFDTTGPGAVDRVRIHRRGGGEPLEIRPARVVLTAGAGNAELRRRAGLTGEVMQTRALHMVLVRGRLPLLFGHCVDGNKTRVTITSAAQKDGQTVWHVGGQVAEDGVAIEEAELIEHARRELSAAIPGVDLAGAEWATYRVDRAEGRTAMGTRPAGPTLREEGNVITAWPTKLALVPELAKLVLARLPKPDGTVREAAVPVDWPRPRVAPSPWEIERTWHRFD